MGLARARGLPVIVVGDIDKGGVFAALYGTLALLGEADQAHVSGFVINKFRGDETLLTPALRRLRALTGRPVLGVVPYLPGIWLDAEDAVAIERPSVIIPNGPSAPLPAREPLRVAVIRLPRISNFTDADALALEPGVTVRFTVSPAEVAEADLAVLPGTRATVADLEWLRGRGLDAALARRAASGRPVLGICGGYQMLGEGIRDGIEGPSEAAAGLGLLPVTTRFAPGKTLGRPSGYAGAMPVSGYEIHHGAVRLTGGEAWFTSEPGGGEPLDGCRRGPVSGTLWHGVFENDAFRQAYLSEVAGLAGREFAPVPGMSFEAARQAQFDMLADAVARHVDTEALLRLIEHGPPARMPAVPRAGRLRNRPH